MTKLPDITDALRGRVVYVFVIMLVLQLSYPLSLQGQTQSALYFSLYCALLGSGVFVASVNRRHFRFASGVALLTFVIGLPWVLTQGEVLWLTLANYLALAVFQSTIVFILLEYIFVTEGVTRDVLYAAVTVYMLFGNIFTALFMLTQTLDPQALAVSGTLEAPIVWQRVVYFSYSTLSTLGYGDIVPRSAWAQALAALEAMLGRSLHRHYRRATGRRLPTSEAPPRFSEPLQSQVASAAFKWRRVSLMTLSLGSL